MSDDWDFDVFWIEFKMFYLILIIVDEVFSEIGKGCLIFKVLKEEVFFDVWIVYIWCEE